MDKKEPDPSVEKLTEIAVKEGVIGASQSFRRQDTVTQEYDRTRYEDHTKMKVVKKAAYQKPDGSAAKTTNDPYSGAVLHRDQNAAEKKYGQHAAMKHKSETDHVVPLKQIHDKYKNNPFLSDADLKEIANQESNLKEISARTNRSKGDQSFREYAQKHPELSEAEQAMQHQAEKKSERQIRRGVAARTVSNAGKVALDGAKQSLNSAAPALLYQGTVDLVKVMRGEKDVGKAVLDLAKTAGTVAASGAAISLGQQLVGKHGDVALVGKIASGIIVVKRNAEALASGQIDSKECIHRTLEDGLGAILSYASNAMGYALGGTLAASACSFAVSLAYDSFVQTAREYRTSARARKDAELYALFVLDQQQKFREALSYYEEQYFAQQEAQYKAFCQDIQQAIQEENADLFFTALNQMGEAFHVQLQFRSFDEFDSYMQDQNTVLTI